MLVIDTTLQNRYRIERLMGQGGMGAVYQAIDQRLGTTVALKECFFTDEVLRKQFEREAQWLARLRHPAMTKVIDHFNEGDGQFLVMEFVDGDDLFDMLKSRGEPFPAGEVMEWADQLLDALDYLHTQQPPIIHRDIKPQNLKLIGRGQIILLDFGLAKSLIAGMSRVTTSGSIFGYTPSYAPLEQIQGTGTDPRSDLYSLAATLYHLLTNAIPPTALSRAAAVLNGEPDPLRQADEINPKLPSSLSAVLMKAMALNRDQRPSDASAMRNVLTSKSRTQPVSGANGAISNSASGAVSSGLTQPRQPDETAMLASPSPGVNLPSPAAIPQNDATARITNAQPSAQTKTGLPRSTPMFWIAGGLVVVVAIIALIVAASNNGKSTANPALDKTTTTVEPRPSPNTETAPVNRALTGHKKDVMSVSFAPDGAVLASGSNDGTVRLWDTRTGELKQTLDESGGEVVSVSFSRNGKALAIAAVRSGGEGSVFIVDPLTGEQKKKLVEDNINSIAFSPDGLTLAVGNVSGSLRLWDVETGAVRLTLEGQEVQTRSVAFSPDGKTIAAGGYGNTVKIWDAQTGVLKRVLEGHENELLAVAFSSDGQAIASGGYDYSVRLWEAETGALKRTLTGFDSPVTSVGFSPDGKLLAAAVSHSVLLWDTHSGALKQTLTGGDGTLNSVAFSPDGKTVAGGSGDATVRLWDVSSIR